MNLRASLRMILLVVLFAPGNLRAQAMMAEQPGRVLSLKTTANGVLLTMERGEMSITVYAPDIIRFRLDLTPAGNDLSYAVIRQAAGAFKKIEKRVDGWNLVTDSLTVSVKRDPLRISITNGRGELLSEDYQPFAVTWQGTEVTAYKKLFPDEKFIGMGEKTGNLDRRGEKFVNWNSDVPAYALNEDPLYVSIPFFTGIHGGLTYGIFLDNTFKTMFDFAASTDNQFIRFSAAAGPLNYYFFGASTVGGIIEDYTWLTGRMEMPPLWSLGYQQCRWGYYPESEVMSLAQKFRDKQIPCDVIYLDIDYMEGYKIFTWNSERFPRPKEMIAKLNAMGFHVVTIVDPGIKVEKGYFAYEEGLANRYFATYPDGSFYTGSVWPGRCHFPDFTSEKSRLWWGSSFRRLVEPGVEGFWNDMNEPSAWGQNIPDIVEFDFEGRRGTMAEAHNVYGLNMARATFEGTKSLMNGKRPFILTRAGYAGIQRYSAVWTGDNEATDDHMMLGVRLVNSMGLSGLSFTGPDMGGFIGQPTKELYQRWLTLGVFTPFFRNHSAVDTKDKEPWSLGEDAERFSKEWISLRYRLIPYIYSAFHASVVSGMPVARSLAIDYTRDEKIWWWRYQHQYLFGDHILVAPVSSEQGFAKVYLPEGDWYRLRGDQLYPGRQEVIVEAPLNDLPVFVKASGIIPMQSAIQNTGQLPEPVLDLHLYRGTVPSQFLYYEDDGVTYRYKEGVYCKRVIRYDPASGTLSLGPCEGSYASRFTAVRLILHGFDSPMQLTADGTETMTKKRTDKEQFAVFPWKALETVVSGLKQ